MQDLQRVLEQTWDHYKLNKIDPLTHRPLGDPDILGFGDSGKQYFMTFSETVSYALFRAVWMNDQITFNQVWEWAYFNLWRKNVDEIFYWQINQWGEMPQVRKDNLFAWRYVDNIKKKGRGGVIFFKWSLYEDLWRDGLDSAPDGDELIAASLALAHGLWGSQKGVFDYLDHAKAIIPEIWNKCVKQTTPGLLDNFSSRAHLKSWFVYTAPSALLTRTLVGGPRENSQAMEVNYFVPNTKWAGVGKKLDGADFSTMKGIRFSAKGEDGHRLRILLKSNQVRKETEALTEITLTAEWKYYTLPFSEFHSADPTWIKRVDGLYLQAQDNNQKGSFSITDIHVFDDRPIGQAAWHLTSNDKGESWINVSYYMPAFYSTIFKALDPAHPWELLSQSAYADATLGARAELRDEENALHKGLGTLIPDWFALTVTGAPTNVPWSNNLSTDDYMHGWDAFRFDYFAALDLAWTGNPQAKKYLMETGPYAFYKNELDRNGKINRGYTIDGKTLKGLRGTDEEGPGPNGNYLALFTACGDQTSSAKILDNLMNIYHSNGYWGDNPLEYYEQNWAWLGLAFHVNQGVHLKAALQKLL
jgi:endo-1,4-beta-D-glucanase Y